MSLSSIFSSKKSLFAFNIHEQTLPGIKEKIEFKKYKNKPVLLVNIATRCGYTGQLDELEAVYKKYKKEGLLVVGIPSNDFGGQTPEGEKEVAKFCRLKYGVTFPLTKKMVVKGKSKNKFMKELLSSSENSDEIGWNFEKFLFDKNGKLIARFDSSVKPDSKKLTKKIEELIK